MKVAWGIVMALALNVQAVCQPAPADEARLPDEFPASLRRPVPVEDINQAVVFTINETTASDYAVDLSRRTGTDLLIRGWFKWHQAPPVQQWRDVPAKIHQSGALFGGGITCSALYDGGNGLTQEQLLDMATRGPDGQLVNAWGQAGIRHGSLSTPAYLDYLFRWCREQMDAGVDCLFMDEHNAALQPNEGFDDHSLNDFRIYLLEHHPATRGWAPNDARWQTRFKIEFANPQICPGGDMRSFNYRGYLRERGLLGEPDGASNPLAAAWRRFRAWRNHRAWQALTERIRAYAASKGRRVLLNANGLARYVDLQVMGVWGQWLVKDGQVDLSRSQLPDWRELVVKGQTLAGKRVPVVLFHDWGMGDPPFPWLAVSPSQREVWMRTRGAEIYAAGGFFAFPVLGPFGCDAGRDGTLGTIVRQTRFYQAHRQLYSEGRFLGSESARTTTPNLSLAEWTTERPREVALHVINREVRDGRIHSRSNVIVELPLACLPESAYAVSPDWPGERPVTCALAGSSLKVTLKELEAYAVVRLRYAGSVDVSRLKDSPRLRLEDRWERPSRSIFTVAPDGSVEHGDELNGFLQGRLHVNLRNPPTFLVKATAPGRLLVQVRAVATGGARLEYRVDGQVVRAVALPDRDGKNDSRATEYDQVLSLPIPAGAHRLTLDNFGPDWLVMTWLEFQGNFGPVAPGELGGE